MIKFNTGACTIDQHLLIKRADEGFYKYIGQENYNSLVKSCHPEDLDRLKFSLKILADEGTAMCSYRLRRSDGKYRWVLIQLEYDTADVQEESLIHVNFQDIASLSREIMTIKNTNAEYHAYFSLLEEIFLMYDPETHLATFFTGSGEDKIVLWQGDLDDFVNNSIRENVIDGASRSDFEALARDVKDLKRKFNYTVYGKSDLEGDFRKIVIHGKTVRIGSRNRKVIATIMILGEDLSVSSKSQEYERDTTTDLLTKSAITDYARNAIANADGRLVHLCIIDLDNFKTINDTFGHMFGDQVLAVAANILKEAVGNKGVCGRIGGDEMMAVIEDVPSGGDLRFILRAIRTNVEYYYKGKLDGVNLTASIGVCTAPYHARNYDDAFKIADKMLYYAKEKGKNRYIIYTPEIHGDVLHEGVVKKTAHGPKIVNKIALTMRIMEGFYKNASKTAYQIMLREVIEAYQLVEVDIFYGELNHCFIGQRVLEDGYEQVNSTSSLGDASIEYVLKDDFSNHFDSNGIAVIDGLLEINELYPAAYDYMIEHKYTRAIICRMEDEHGYVVYYSNVPGARKAADLDVTNLAYIAKVIELSII